MKKLTALLLAAVLVFSFMTVASAEDILQNSGITVTINSEPVTFDTEPIVISDRTFVPIRAVCEKLGADVYWDETDQTVLIVKNSIKLELEIDSKIMNVINSESYEDFMNAVNSGNDEQVLKEVAMDVAPIIHNDRTLLPIRAVCEALGTNVGWDEATSEVIITCTEEMLNDKNRDKTFFDKLKEYSDAVRKAEAAAAENMIVIVDASGNTIIIGDDITEIAAVYDEESGEHYVEVTLTTEGQKKFAEATEYISKQENNYFSVYVNGSIVSEPRVYECIDSDTVAIKGDFTEQEVSDFVNQFDAE